MEHLQILLDACPQPPTFAWDWRALAQTPVGPFLARMEEIPQNPAWHGEGSVGRHTHLVCEALARDPAFRALPPGQRQALAVAALLHDIGKIPTTKFEDGRWTSPHHSTTGARMARELLWKAFGLCGTPEKQNFRETVCQLLRHHMLPGHILDQADPERRLLLAAGSGQLCRDFSLECLCMLAEADIRGRIAGDTDQLLEKVALCRQEARELGCLQGPGAFADAYTQRAYFRGRSLWREQRLFNDTWGEVILLCGLPGTGKDTWAQAHAGHLPVVSLDDLRRAMGVSPQEAQGRVAQAAREQAREYLRARQPFLWNATNLTASLRGRLIGLCEGYGAAVRVVYLETGWEENLRRNRAREAAVPEGVIEHMLGNLVPPQRWEAQEVEWRCT